MLPVFQILTLLKLLILALAGKSRNIISNGSFWLILYLFSIHQIIMYMPSTAAPKPCPTLVQKAGPKIWTIIRQKWLKNPYPFGRYTPVFAYNPSKQTPRNHLVAILNLKKHLISINEKKKFKRILVEGENFKLRKMPSKDFIALFSSRGRACLVLKHNRVSEVFKGFKVHDFEYLLRSKKLHF